MDKEKEILITPEKIAYISIFLIIVYKLFKGDFDNGISHKRNQQKDYNTKKAAAPGGGYKIVGDKKYNYTYIPSELEKKRKEKRKKTDPKRIFKEPKR